MVSGSDDRGILAPPTAPLTTRLANLLVLLVVIALFVISFQGAGIPGLPLLVTKAANTGTYLKDFLRPDFSDWQLYAGRMWQTIEIAIWATGLSILIAIPLSFVSARNIAPAWLVQPVRSLTALMRAFPDIVLGTAFIVAVGPGPLAGVLALSISNAGTLAKLFSEAVENIEAAPVEGVRATGGSKLHEIIWGVVPQVAALWTSFALYRFESNARSATVLGLIGAGGIGQLLFDNLNGFAYSQVSAIALIIVAAVTLIDILSQQIRKRLV
jgi:phosphonate transport system permease protein